MGTEEITLSEAVTVIVRELMGQRGIGKKELSQRSGIPKSTVYAILNDERDRIPIEIVDQMAEGLGVNPAELVARADVYRRDEVDARLRKYLAPAARAEVARLEREMRGDSDTDGAVSDPDQEGDRRRASGG